MSDGAIDDKTTFVRYDKERHVVEIRSALLQVPAAAKAILESFGVVQKSCIFEEPLVELETGRPMTAYNASFIISDADMGERAGLLAEKICQLMEDAVEQFMVEVISEVMADEA